MNIAGLLFLLAAHYLCGRGILRMVSSPGNGLADSCLSLMVGVPALSLVPCLLQLLHIHITVVSVWAAITICMVALNVPALRKWKGIHLRRPAMPAAGDWPFFVLFFLLASLSVWRCYYFPPFSGDVLSGPELIAEYTVREKTMINSVFTTDLHTTNNYFKSPYITGLQITYKLLVSNFGQLWLSVLFVSFFIWLYSIVRARLHALPAGMLMFFFMAAPELYAYTYNILYDYSNMIFFFMGFYFLTCFFEDRQQQHFALACLAFGLATYIRTETLVLAVMVVPLLWLRLARWQMPVGRQLRFLAVWIAVPALFYAICIHVFVRLFVPLPFHVAGQINPDLSDMTVLVQRMKDMLSVLIFSQKGPLLYGYLMWIFCLVLVADVVFARKWNIAASTSLYGIGVVFFGLALLGYLLPLMDLDNTTKRGLFKIMPLMVFYICNSATVRRISGSMADWERGVNKQAAGQDA